MRRLHALVLVLALVPIAARAQDVCAGAQAPSRAAGRRMETPPINAGGAGAAIAGGTVGVARGATMYPGSGAGPIPDVTNWQPRGKMPIGTELIIQGRGLVPGQFNAMLGGNVLTPTAQTPYEIRFRVNDPTPAAALVVWATNGQPRTLETAFVAYDPTPYITRVVPTVFGSGDPVTICGSGLFEAFFADVYSPTPVAWATPLDQVKTQQGNFIQVADKWIAVNNPTIAPTGDRITFRAGDAFTTARACRSQPCNSPQTWSDFPAAFTGGAPGTISGPVTVRFTGVNRNAIGPSVTWKGVAQAPPRITAVYGKYFSSKDPFVILPTASTQNNMLSQAYVEGANLANVTWKIGAMTVAGGTSGPGMPSDGSYAILSVPLNASTGVVCASSTMATACSSSPLPVFGAPVFSRVPSLMSLALRTNYTIEGINLLPPSGISGVTYKWEASMGSLAPSANNVACNRVLEVLEHTATRITFRVGDPAKTAPVPATCTNDRLYTGGPDYVMQVQASLVGAQGIQNLTKGIPFSLKP